MAAFASQPAMAMDMGSEIYSQESVGPVELFPNPTFVFPARPDVPTSQPAFTMSSIARRPRSDQNLASSASASIPRTRASVSALPSFSFNPAGTTRDSTPPHSPSSLNAPSTPSRSARHRRGGSEFIGGQSGNVNLVSTSPAKAEFGSVQPPLHLGPPAGRRHAHRRSGAISCHDLNSILQPKDSNAQMRAGSAPTSPMDLDAKSFFPGLRRGSQQSLRDTTIAESPKEADVDDDSSRRPPSRARVGFADRVEYIRPLSTISSETESSMSTIRGHSVTNSFSSVASVGATSPSPARMARPSLNTTFEDEPPRPQTSQALFGSPLESRPFLSVGSQSAERPKSEAGLSSSTSNSPIDAQPKRKSFGWWESKQKRSISPHSFKPSPNSSQQHLSVNVPSSPHSSDKAIESDQETVKDVLCTTKKPRKVRSWAHSLLPRKHKTKKTRSTTPPPQSQPSDSDTEDTESNASQSEAEQPTLDANFEVNFDEDNTVTIIDEAAQQPASLRVNTVASRPIRGFPEPDVLSPVIDLDAALGPFNTPFGQPAWNGPRQTRARRSMHSSNASLSIAAFSAGQPHRRTESAPELLPFDARNSKFGQPAMPDVFEEEDEELEAQDDMASSPIEDSETVEHQEDSIASTGVHVVDIDEAVVAAGPWPVVSGFGSARRKKSEGLSIDTGSRPSSMVFDGQLQISSNRQSLVVVDDIEVVEDYEEVRGSKSSDDTITPPHTGDKISVPTAPLRFAMPLPPEHIMTPDSISDASLRSPFFSPSTSSLDTSRLDTGASSATDAPSFCFGEPGPEVRVSVDDVPSLTSSRSTMTSPANQQMPPPSSAGRTPSVYSVRSTGTADYATHKRGSIASLSRLVASGFGERSKLSIESRPQSQQLMTEPKKEKSRHRISKRWQFWKSKENISTA
ncbi:hypothetical protein BT63DRAFT_230682 [Microthyrium microscopicum]|uniref:Cell wall proline rich protein n=1 Tax=Microthyrium microscopicum TaxID=703497 RepID=A0A6A6UES4_9PEZI|nr:hypothetical protein BT63DRAFT_230682 [Microthyrium microscopicum]